MLVKEQDIKDKMGICEEAQSLKGQTSFFHNKITTVSFIMSIVIVLFHSYNIERYTDVNRVWQGSEYFISRIVGSLAVPMFFFMSSFLFFRNYSKKQIVNKYKSRFKSIVVPYLLWNMIYFIIFAILLNFPFSSLFMDTKGMEISFRELIQAIFFYKYNIVYWFMYQLITLILISPIVYYMIRGRMGIIMLGFLFVLGYILGQIPNISHGIYTEYLIYWGVGAYFALHKSQYLYRRAKLPSYIF